ncbi:MULTISPECIES: alpha/beta fold hydrolase [unclassified Streptomyces]|uniref:alpha/beta fold hydrolase n=1 Tax=unclassified Streptomyces TaxID=2593676 RepID=UPI00224D7186|nr:MULTISPECIES: alpha/beta hydrolase [unclassified Streptomyces]WSP58355.1 alpha/beta hydrolase [Streptomyces sp. NBC_01241]WSU21070.1 alpha/beta hydrolase [Streptomyces sp. NBC_01108]MCX4790107.1 alpha/beta hydrolase [Streptomyces sp. NBC_01221]MCX4794166.1 alpha/beta hydrolase [Streptomyces sp. NBC_01242]WSP61993.1 alpha/beta hydrolase [Streptomyces sp. NBC_01240]
MPELELSAGTIDYQDSGGDGPVVVLLHGVAMDGSLWRHVVAGLQDDFRCVVPTLPLGGHRQPMHPDADLSILGVARLVDEFLERLDLSDVTLVLNDWGGAQSLVADGRAARIGRLVITSCEAFGNYPPGLPGSNLVTSARLPGGLALAFNLLRLKPMRRLPVTWGWMAKRPVPPEIMDAWFRPVVSSAGVRRDLRKYVLSTPPKAELLAWSEALRTFDRPALVAWAAEDRVMPLSHGRRLAELLPRAELVEIADSYTLIPEDQPTVLTAHLRNFLDGRS